MSFAVVQTELTAPTEEQLVQAFAATATLRLVDAREAARHQFGVIAEGLSDQDAQALQVVLAGAGAATRVIDQSELPPLPMPRGIHRIDCLETALQLYDGMGRTISVGWDEVVLIAAGNVEYVKEVFSTLVMPQLRLLTGVDGSLSVSGDAPTRQRREESASRILLEIQRDRPWPLPVQIPGWPLPTSGLA